MKRLALLILTITDPTGDDTGIGTYTYPTDGVFIPGSFDLTAFTAAADDETMVFKFKLVAPINNPWDSGINLSVQTFDIYVDTDPGAGTGARKLLEGRNASLAAGNGWDVAVWVEGWSQKVLTPNATGDQTAFLGDYPSTKTPVNELTPNDFAIVPLVGVE